MSRVVNRIMLVWLGLALLFWAVYLIFARFIPQILYYYLWLGLAGIPIWLNRQRIATRLTHWRWPPLVKFLLLGYGMVLSEEIIAALCNNISEGFSFSLWIERIGQFWALNVLAFTGLIVGWYLLQRFIGYGRQEAFYLVGLFGLFSEKTIFVLLSSPLDFFLFAPLNIFTYGVILTPALLSRPEPGRRRIGAWLAYPLALVIPFLCALVPVGILIDLRAHFPNWFPPRKFVS